MSTGIRSQLAPKGLQFNPSDFFISDHYATILTVVSYPKYIQPGYLSSLTNMPGIKVVVKHIPVPFSQMAKMLNIKQQSYARYENNTAEPMYEMLVKISKIFSVSCDYLLGNEEY